MEKRVPPTGSREEAVAFYVLLNTFDPLKVKNSEELFKPKRSRRTS